MKLAPLLLLIAIKFESHYTNLLCLFVDERLLLRPSNSFSIDFEVRMNFDFVAHFLANA